MKKILIVDDESNIQLLYRTMLESCGYEVQCCCDILEARRLLASFRPDLLILDIKLQGDEDGIVFLDEFRTAGNRLPVIIMTAYEVYQQNFKTWAADEFLVKSSDTQPLMDAVKRLI